MFLVLMADNRPKEGRHSGALVVFEKWYGEKSLDAANVSYNLCDALRQELAEPVLRKVLETYIAVLGKDSPKVAQVYFWLGDTQHHIRSFDSAENLKTTK
jgi:hypothetical protein